ncbi:hypothetical protein L6164_023668 [Bauhinia variegata]|uniref:Uncharacterized protein n=1 Tax=Bauhinia variegata TaxID=167791 RepID=A0ACB9MJH9_BAUVA|nr:hypothetical protein L6164_023668 [Bauhinia variegata]
MLIETSNNIVCKSAFGHKYSTHDGSSNLAELARKLLTQFTAFSVGDFFPSLSWLDVITGLVGELNTTFQELDAFFDVVIADHKNVKRNDVSSDKNDFVDILLQLQEGGNINFELTRETFKCLLLDMFVAGTDTSSTTLEWVFAELLKNPILLKKVQEEFAVKEVDEVILSL